MQKVMVQNPIIKNVLSILWGRWSRYDLPFLEPYQKNDLVSSHFMLFLKAEASKGHFFSHKGTLGALYTIAINQEDKGFYQFDWSREKVLSFGSSHKNQQPNDNTPEST
jgi:hypothetical protein